MPYVSVDLQKLGNALGVAAKAHKAKTAAAYILDGTPVSHDLPHHCCMHSITLHHMVSRSSEAHLNCIQVLTGSVIFKAQQQL